jgi:fatty-acyl-CoA synthase
LLIDQFQLADARISVSAGGPRGMRVSVSLPQASQSIAAAVQQALDAYLFEAKVRVG